MNYYQGKMLSILAVLGLFSASSSAQFLLAGLLKNGGESVATTASPSNPNVPSFCHGLECPKFNILESNDQFEVRHYAASQWVATRVYEFYYSDTIRTGMFQKLFHYISGNNSANMKIPMTAPVVTEIEHGLGPDCENNFTMHFMIPFNLQANPPMPIESGVYIRNVPEMTVLVKQYGGFSTDELKQKNLEQFIKDLDAAGKKYEDRAFYTAGYDGPYRFTDRTNELWVIQK